MPALRPLRSAPLLLGLLVFVGCQSFETGVEVICQAPKRCSECMEAPPDQQTRKLAQHIEGLLRNGEAKKLMNAMAGAPVESKVKLLREAAERAKLTSCPFADHLEASAATEPEPEPVQPPPMI